MHSENREAGHAAEIMNPGQLDFHSDCYQIDAILDAVSIVFDFPCFGLYSYIRSFASKNTEKHQRVVIKWKELKTNVQEAAIVRSRGKNNGKHE